MSIAWLNGQLLEEDAARVALDDTGLLHAAGVFTTMRAIGGRVFRLEHHLRRLRTSCEALFVPLQYRDGELADAVGEVLARNEFSDARLRLTVTRGQAVNDPVHGMVLTPNCFLTAAEASSYPPEYYAKGMLVVLEDEQRLNPYDIQAGHKTLNYFSRLTSMRQAAKRGAGETLWFNTHNYLQSGSITNIFVVIDGTLTTPPTQEELRVPEVSLACPYPRSNVLPGVTRGAVLELAQTHGIATKLAAINVNQLLDAQEVFLTNSIMQIMPVSQIEQHRVGESVPGPLTAKLMKLLQETVATGA